MDAVLAAQQELFGRISRTMENLKKAGSSKITFSFVATTLKLLDAKWTKFEENHERLRSEHWSELKNHDYYLADIMGQAEEVYTQQRAALLEMSESLKMDKESSPSVLTGAPPPPRTTLPRIQLPHFSGRYEDWPPFRDLFQSLIIDDASLSDVTRLHYLKSSLKEEAETLIRSFPTTRENFARAWDTLLKHYENTRLLVRSCFTTYLSLPKLKTESASELRKLFHCMASTVGALEGIGRPISNCENLFVHLTAEMLDPRTRREWESSIGGSTEPPTYAELREFLERRLHTLEAIAPSKASSTVRTGERATGSHLVQKDSAKRRERDRCSACHKDHFVMLCESFRRKSPMERKRFVDESGLCLNCLSKHKVSECNSKRMCTACGERHHTMLHDACRPASSGITLPRSDPATTSHVTQSLTGERTVILLATARVNVRDRHGVVHHARALVDQGSETSLISEALAQKLRLPRTRTSAAVFGVGGCRTGTPRGQVSVRIGSRDGNVELTVQALVLPRLTVYSGVSSVLRREWSHLRGIELADPDFAGDDRIELLLGADVYASILEPGLRRGNELEPLAQETRLGWILSGPVGVTTSHAITAFHHCTADESLAALVRRFWEQEELCASPSALSREDQEAEDFFVRTHTREPDGRYMVRLPVTTCAPVLSASRRIRTRVLRHMERRFERDEALKHKYTSFMAEYEQLGHMSPAPAEGISAPVCYLPHHGVMKGDGATAKLRVVFNGSADVGGGESLNRALLVGPNLLP